MNKRTPFQIIKRRHVTEKSLMQEKLKNSLSSRSASRCDKPKYVFVVDPTANKREIAWAVEQIYREKNIRVVGVNTITLKPKSRNMRGRNGKTSAVKKAIVTLTPDGKID